MNWRDTIIGALVTLCITIVAGVIVYYVTKEPKELTPAEKLVYRLDTSATFGSEQNKLTFLTIHIQNAGNKSAKNVKIAATIEQGFSIEGKQIAFSVGKVADFQDTSSGNTLSINVPSFPPTETTDISLLVRGSGTPNLQVGVLSDDTVGSAVPTTLATPEDRVFPVMAIIILIFAALAFQQVVNRFMSLRFYTTRNAPSPRNDTAFVYLQKGLTKEAEKLLALEIEWRGGGPLALANYGLAIGLNGDVQGAAERLDAAAWWATEKHEKEVVEYNKAILNISQGTTKEAIADLRAAFRLSRTNIARYCALNTYIRAACDKDPEFLALVQQHGRQPSSRTR